MMRWPVTSDIMRTLVVALLLLAGCSSTPPPAPYDVLITGGSVIDGDGTPPVRTDLGIRDGHIAQIGDLSAATALRRIDATGLTVAPGFIDIHNHSDYTILLDPKAESMIRQGVTTMVLGESRSAGPVKPGADARDDGVDVDWTTLGGYFGRLERQRMATNIASYVGEEQVWTYVKGYDQSPATAAELEAMKALVAAAMEEGAMGLSTALLMPPSSLATTANLAELATVARRYGGIYSTHIRDEGEGVFQAIAEAIQVGADAKIPVDIIHMKIAHKKLWGRASEIAAMVQKARDAGLDIRANVYPYTAGQNNLSSIIPPWAHDGGREKLLERLRDPGARRRMRTEILNGLPGWYNHYLATGDGWGGMQLVSLRNERNAPFQGKRMAELIAEPRRRSRRGAVRRPARRKRQRADGLLPPLRAGHAAGDEAAVDLDRIRRDAPSMPTARPAEGIRIPGTTARFPRVLGRYVRELHVLTLPEAVRKMTSMNADKIGIKDRGRLREGLWADVTIFDANRVIDRATFDNPHQYPGRHPICDCERRRDD